jgi:hypothetical protein
VNIANGAEHRQPPSASLTRSGCGGGHC